MHTVWRWLVSVVWPLLNKEFTTSSIVWADGCSERLPDQVSLPFRDYLQPPASGWCSWQLFSFGWSWLVLSECRGCGGEQRELQGYPSALSWLFPLLLPLGVHTNVTFLGPHRGGRGQAMAHLSPQGQKRSHWAPIPILEHSRQPFSTLAATSPYHAAKDASSFLLSSSQSEASPLLQGSPEGPGGASGLGCFFILAWLVTLQCLFDFLRFF